MSTTLSFQGVSKTYGTGAGALHALRNATFDVGSGEFVIILGPSGAGKSTLLNLLGGMDTATEGRILLGDADIAGLRGDAQAAYRAQHVGFVFQFYNLIPTLTALENVEISKHIAKETLDAKSVLRLVGLEKHMHHFPSQLSGGEQQRVSIARALYKNPTLLLCDEPTGALDSETGQAILTLLKDMSRTHGRTVIIVTHNAALADAADRVIHLRDGRVSSVRINENPIPISEVTW